ncbi:hypothetical protein PSHT_00256 [Puccinia striiformis]|uniref:Uncharacterized protein n=1 Tax=Puccinia striiformis TaxID=27350 RepID=A0A2S4WNP3_9BASI|nr:hypothetical protein PSHT_00256 [Puccinia striiformis]
MVRARIVSTSEGKKRKQPEADDSVDEDMGQIERVKDDGDEQALTTGIDEKLSGTCPHPSPRDGSRGIWSNLELIDTTSSDIPFYLDPMGCARRYTVAQIAQEEEIELGRSMSEPFVASLTELASDSIRYFPTHLTSFPFMSLLITHLHSVRVLPKTQINTFAIEHLALELKAFAAHAGRCTIREEDVKLVCRKSTVLQELLEEEAQRCNTASSTLMAAGQKMQGSSLKSYQNQSRSGLVAWPAQAHHAI